MSTETGEQAFERRLRELDAIANDPASTPEDAFDAAETAYRLRRVANVTLGEALANVYDADAQSWFR